MVKMEGSEPYNFRMPKELLREIKKVAKRSKRTVAWVIRETLMSAYLPEAQEVEEEE
jgi:predicted DNA-binding protein